MGRLLCAALLVTLCSAALAACGGSKSDVANPTIEPRPASSLTAQTATATAGISPAASPSSANTPVAAPSASPSATTVASPTAVPATPTSPPAPQLTPVAPTAAPPTVAPTSAPPPPANVTVTLLDSLAFSPASVTIGVGSSVTFNWQGGQFHDVGSSVFPSDPAGIKNSGSYRVTFTAPGSYPYFCSVHVGMQGAVTVQ
jgi:plastocyanin